MTSGGCLVIGANGLVGRHIGASLGARHIPWTGTRNRREEAGLIRLDITDTGSLASVFSELAPKAVFLCANLSGGVDFCEKNPKAAEDFYLSATKIIGALCAKNSAQLLFISTDYVFDGTKGPYREGDAKNPLNLYGRLKAAAEEWIESNLDRYIIIRTTNVFGWDPQTVTPNYMMQLYRALSSGKSFNAPSFLWGNPTLASELADAIVELYRNEAKGVFHVVGSTFMDRYSWALKACDVLGLDAGLVTEIKKPQSAMIPRPLKPQLDTGKAKRAFKIELSDIDAAMRKFKKEMLA